MTTAGGCDAVTCGAMEIRWHPPSRLAVVRFSADVDLTETHGGVLTGALERWVGASPEPFALLADAKGVCSTDSDYRARTGLFFGQHRAAARIAIINTSPIIRAVVEMFRVGVRLHLRTFGDEAGARAWLRKEGIGA